LQCEGKEDHEKWIEENEKLREMVEKLMSAGKHQMSTFTATLHHFPLKEKTKLSPA